MTTVPEKKTLSGYFIPVVSTMSGDDSTLIDLRQVIVRFRVLLLVGTVFGGMVMLLLSFVLTPKYHVSILLAPVEYTTGSSSGLSALASRFGGMSTLAGFSFNEGSSRHEALAVLGSRALTTKFLQERDLLPILYSEKWDRANNSWAPDNPSEIPTLESAYREFDQDIRTIVYDRETGLVTLTIAWKDRVQAAEWANQLVERANFVIRDRAIDEFNRSITYLNEELDKTAVVGIRQAIYTIIESQIENVMLANVREDYAFKVLDPAVPPDADDVAFPNRVLFVFVGLALGFAVAVGVSAVLSFSRSQKMPLDL